ncbi:MAG: hypothetical protein IKW52_03530 [Alistipes sp.]|nr:hypothetical protein [Alistipes sp.]
MRRFYNICAFAALVIAVVACTKEPISDGVKNPDVEINIPHSSDYIGFTTETITRGILVEERYMPYSFGVLGYKYDYGYSWTGQRAVAKLNVFNIDADNKATSALKVDYSDGYYTYEATNAGSEDSGLIRWGSERYSFFAYYPYSIGSIVLSALTMDGAPYLTYTFSKDDTSLMADIITGKRIDLLAGDYNNTVPFDMIHRLAGVDVTICNAYEYTYDTGNTNNDGTKIYASEAIEIDIQDLVVEFDGVQYDTAKIYLDRDDILASDCTMDNYYTASYHMIGDDCKYKSYLVKPTVGVNNTNISKETENSLAFIPQAEEFKMLNSSDTKTLSVTANVKYHKKRPGGGYLMADLKTDENGKSYYDDERSSDTPFVYETSKTATFTQSLKNASRYFVLLTFTSEAVSINILTAAEWDEEEIEYEFE